ncbi:asparagine synthetase B family protein [Sphaerisporangium rufum]|uniref:asparagine synthetase B family protein n=1 Tax=Sphaerisporangium rufum TaxID=1381558 RepID=UPI0019515AB0|nr:asparagine synthase-related protein [Sphaerisporangium rufum]
MAVIGGQDLPAGIDAVLERMSRAVGHRGPDAERHHREGPVALAFRRLALVGPESGDQPLFSEDGTCALIANGEVYNHHELAARERMRLRTRSDCEVLPNLYARYDVRFLDDVQGMCAVVLWDRARDRLVLARDRFGIKPLYYARAGDTVVFASEIKALFEHPGCPRELDWEVALADQSMTSAPQLTDAPVTSWFRGVHLVPAGTVVSIDLRTGDSDEHVYWRLPSFTGGSDASEEELVGAYRDLLASSVRACASADTELGLFLSGGVDSAAVAALAAAGGTPLHTFSVLSGSTLANGDAESAHRAAAALGLPNHQVLFDFATMPGAAEWKRLLWLLETPLCGPEQYFKYELYRHARHARPGLRGMLLGAGSDEYNGGFSTIFGTGEGWAGFQAGIGQLARAGALRGRPALASWQDGPDGPLLADTALGPPAGADPYPAYVAWRHRHMLQYNCWHEDRTAAGNGVEARVPFLDHRIVELLAGIPPHRRAALLWDKAILRRAVAGVVPGWVAARPKVPFYYGDGAGYTHRMVVRMLAQDGASLVEEALHSPGGRRFLRPDTMRAALARLGGQGEPWEVEQLFRLVNLGLLDAMARAVPPVPLDAPARAVLPAVPVADWDRDAPALAVRLEDRTPPALDGVLGFRDDVLVVHEPAEPHRMYVSVAGSLEYVAEAADDPAWFALLREIDGRRTLGELLAASGQSYDAVAGVLRDTIGAGVLQEARP